MLTQAVLNIVWLYCAGTSSVRPTMDCLRQCTGCQRLRVMLLPLNPNLQHLLYRPSLHHRPKQRYSPVETLFIVIPLLAPCHLHIAAHHSRSLQHPNRSVQQVAVGFHSTPSDSWACTLSMPICPLWLKNTNSLCCLCVMTILLAKQTWHFEACLRTRLNTPRRAINRASKMVQETLNISMLPSSDTIRYTQCIRNTYFMSSLACLWAIDLFLWTKYTSSKLWAPSWMS